MNSITRLNINHIEKVKAFVKACCSLDCDIMVISGRYAIDGKSLMGVFSLDLSNNITVEFSRELTEAEYEPFRQWEVHNT